LSKNNAANFTDLKAIIIDAKGTELTHQEEQLFSSLKPAGFILFSRNCVSKNQVADLVSSMRAAVGLNNIPILIDQEGGSVSRLKIPEWREFSSAKFFGELMGKSREEAFETARLNSLHMAQDLQEMGITVNCAPVLDVPSEECHEFLSESRTYSSNPEVVSFIGEAVCKGLLEGNVTPVIKHIPGHGRSTVDSHLSLPRVEATLKDLSRKDFKPFKYMAHTNMKTSVWAMVAHVVYSGLDSDSAASVSKRITNNIIRKEIGFNGVLIADDISMKALGGTIESRIKATLAAGMDLTMLCNASFEDRELALKASSNITSEAALRIETAEEQRILTNGMQDDEQNKRA